MNKWISKFLNVDLSVNNAGDVECIVSEKTAGCCYKLAFSNKDTEEDIIGRIGKEIYSWISLMRDEMDEDIIIGIEKGITDWETGEML